MTGTDRPYRDFTMADLLSRSSLGTAWVRAVCAQTPLWVRDEILAGVRGLAEEDDEWTAQISYRDGRCSAMEQDDAAVADALASHYVSTYCMHDVHESCRLTCKFCTALCRCSCHDRDGDNP